MTAETIQTVDVSRINFETLIGDNPVLVKHIRSRMRRQQVLPALVMVVIIAALVTWSCFKLDAVREGYAFGMLTVLQGAILFLGGTSQVATAVAQARETGILDFHRVSPVRSVAVTLGFILGAPVREWLLFACLIPFTLACIAGGNPDAIPWLKSLVAMVVAGLLYHTLGALVGVTTKPRTAGSAAVGFVILLFFISGVFWRLTPGPAVAEAIRQPTEELITNRFFGATFSQFTLGLLHQVPLMVFLLIAAVRKIRRERAPVYAKPTAMLFALLIALFLLGDTHSWTIEHSISFNGFTAIFVAYFMAVTGVMLTTAVTPGWGDFANGIRRARKAGHERPAPTADLASNWLPVVVFGIIAVATPFISNVLRHRTGTDMTPGVLAGAIATATVLMYGFAQQTFELTYRRSSRAYFLLFLFLYWVVPILLGAVAGITEASQEVTATLFAISPLAGITVAGGWADTATPPPVAAKWVAVIVPLVAMALFAALSAAATSKAEREAVAVR